MSTLFTNKNETPHKETEIPLDTRIYMDDLQAATRVGSGLFNLIKAEKACTTLAEVIILCIGTDRSTGDCLGPLIGSKLKEDRSFPYHVYGTLDYPVHASNLAEYLEEIDKKHQNPLVVAIDACLGKVDSVGYINLRKGSLKPGAGVNKNLPPVGDIHITGVVNVGGFMEYFVLQNTRLSVVMKMATVITRGIASGCLMFNKCQIK